MRDTPSTATAEPTPSAGLPATIALPEVTVPPAPSAGARRRFAALVLLGYAYVIGMLVLLAGASVGLIAVRLLWPALVLAGVVVVAARALRLEYAPPEGIELTPDSAPALHELVEGTRHRLRAPRIDSILVMEGVGAFVTEIPRLGVLGWNRIYLVLGLPYLLALSPAELEAVIAHELAHVGRRDVAGLAGIRGSLGRWRQLEARFRARRSWSSVSFRPFLRWYLPHLERATLAFKRWSEYEADRIAAEVAGVQPSVTMLLRLHLLDRHLGERVWDGLDGGVEREPEPPKPYVLMRAAASAPFRCAGPRLEEQLRHADSDWTHPALSQRLRAIGVDAVDPSALTAPSPTAADAFVGPGLDDLLAAFDARWLEQFAGVWRERHEEALAQRERLEELSRKEASTRPERLELAALVGKLDGLPAARPLYEELVAENSADSVSAYWLGRERLEAGDDSGLPLLERSAKLYVHATAAAAEVAVPFLIDRRRLDEADAWSGRAAEYAARAAAAEQERSQLRPTDELEPHGLPRQTVAEVCVALADIREIKRAYLVRKRVSEFAEDGPVWILALKARRRYFGDPRRNPNAELVAKAAERVSRGFGRPLRIASLSGPLAALEPMFARIPAALLLGYPSRAARGRGRINPRRALLAVVLVVVVAWVAETVVSQLSGSVHRAVGTPAIPFSPGLQGPATAGGPTAWARAANARCVRARNAYTASVQRGVPTLDARVLYERALVAALETTPGAPPGRAAAVRLARRRVEQFAHAVALTKAGKPAEAARLFEESANPAARVAIEALGARACAP